LVDDEVISKACHQHLTAELKL